MPYSVLNDGILKEAQRFAVFFNNGTVLEIDAAAFCWCEDTLDFYADKEEKDIIAIFKQDTIYGVSLISNITPNTSIKLDKPVYVGISNTEEEVKVNE